MKSIEKLMITLLLGGIYSCSSDAKHAKITSELAFRFKSDSSGCFGYRRKIVNDSFQIIKDFVGYKAEEIVALIGKPSRILSTTSGLTYCYWVDCSILQDSVSSMNKSVIDSEATQLLIEINDKMNVTNVHVITP